LSDAPPSSDELSSDVSSSLVEDVPTSPFVESSSVDSSSEQLIRRSHRLCRPLDYYSPSAFTTTALSEPASYHDAILHPEWQHVMVEDIAALERTGTWDLVPCPPRVCLITCKCVYKVKTHSDGSLERYKVRLVARGFQQEQGCDYDETFAPVAHMITIHTLLTMAYVWEWSVSQFDVKNAFLMVSCVRMFTYIHHMSIMFLRVWFVTFVALCMVLSRLLGFGFSALSL
jgi:hypothetical protein